MWPHKGQHFVVWRHPYLLPGCYHPSIKDMFVQFSQAGSRVLVGALFGEFFFLFACLFGSVWRRCWDVIRGSHGVVIKCVAPWWTARSALGFLGTTSRVWVSGHFTLWLHSFHFWRYFQTSLAPFDNTIHPLSRFIAQCLLRHRTTSSGRLVPSDNAKAAGQPSGQDGKTPNGQCPSLADVTLPVTSPVMSRVLVW